MAKVILKGEKIRLRPLLKQDILLISKWNLDPRVLKLTANLAPLDVEIKQTAIKKMRNLVKKKLKKDKRFIIEAKSGRHWEPIGDCELSVNKRNQSAVFSICVDPNCWSKGYGTEATSLLLAFAFKRMRLHRIESHVAEFNTQSIMFHEKFGFVKEGLQKEAIFTGGRFRDRIIFRLLESEWELNKNR